MEFIFDVIGWAGMFTVLGAYMFEKDILHFTGSVMLGAYSVYYRAWPQVATNTIWAIIATKKHKLVECATKKSEPRAGVEPAISTLEG